MEEQLVKYSTLMLAASVGFRYTSNNSDPHVITLRPRLITQSSLQKWIREVYNIHIAIIPFHPDNYI